MKTLGECLRDLRHRIRPIEKRRCGSENPNATLPWPCSATHFKHAPWRTQEPRRGKDHSERILCSQTECGSRTLQIQVASTKGRRVDRRISDESQRAGKILPDFGTLEAGGNDKGPDRREMLLPTLKQKPLQQENLELAKTVKIARSAETAVQEARLLSQGTKKKNDPNRPCARLSRITSGIV